MRFKQIKKKIKFYLAISFIISLVIMLRVAIKKGNLVCGIYYEPAPCSIFPWIVQLIVFTVGISIILTLLFQAVRAILKYFPEFKKSISKKTEKLKKIRFKTKNEEKTEEKKEIRKEEKAEEKKEKKKEIIRI